MRWREVFPGRLSCEEVAGVWVEIVSHASDLHHVTLRLDVSQGPPLGRVYGTIGAAKRAGLRLMRDRVRKARDEAHNVVLDAELWLHANGGEP